MDRPSKKKKKKKNGPCREVTVKGEEAVSSEVQLNITWYYRNFFWNLVSLKVQQTVLSNTVILTEINEAILLSIEGYCVCRDRYAIFRKLSQSRKLYLCMNSASRIFFSASFLSRFAPPKKKKTICVLGLFTSHTNIEHQMSDQKKLCELVSGHKRLTKNSVGNKFLLGR